MVERLVAVRRHPVLRDRHSEVSWLELCHQEVSRLEQPGGPEKWTGPSLRLLLGWRAPDCEPSLAVAPQGPRCLRELHLRRPHSQSCW